MKIIIKIKNWDVNNLYEWALSDLKWVEKTSQFNENFKKIYN